MLIVDNTMVGVHASKIDAMTELAMLIYTMSKKGMLDKQDVLAVVDAAFMPEEELAKKAEEAKAQVQKATDDKLKKLLKEMLEELE